MFSFFFLEQVYVMRLITPLHYRAAAAALVVVVFVYL